MFFFDTQREGYLPAGQPVAWRDNAYVADYNTTVNLASSLTNDTFGFGGVSEGAWHTGKLTAAAFSKRPVC
jgi:hypothetical protein